MSDFTIITQRAQSTQGGTIPPTKKKIGNKSESVFCNKVFNKNFEARKEDDAMIFPNQKDASKYVEDNRPKIPTDCKEEIKKYDDGSYYVEKRNEEGEVVEHSNYDKDGKLVSRSSVSYDAGYRFDEAYAKNGMVTTKISSAGKN